MNYYNKYLKYKNKYLNLTKFYKQYGSGEDFDWYFNNIKIDTEEEQLLEKQYKNKTNQITFRNNVYNYINFNFINGDNKLTRQQKIIIIKDESKLFEVYSNCVKLDDITLRDKITGQEIERFFKGSSIPYISFNEIYNNGIWNCIFGDFDFNWGKESIELLKLLEDTSKITVLATLTLPLARIDKVSPLPLIEKLNRVKKVYLENLRLNKEICSISETIHKCIFSIMDLPTDKSEWKRSDIALIHYYAGKYFSNALNIINIIDTTRKIYILEYISTHNITNIQVDDFIKKFKWNLVMEKFNHTSVGKQIDIDKKCLGILLKKLLIWNLDNPDGILDDAVEKFKEVNLLQEIVVPNKKIKPVRVPNKQTNESPDVTKSQIDFIIKDYDKTITYDLDDMENIIKILIKHFGQLENLICLDLHGVADLYSNEEIIPGKLPKCIISYIRGRPETIFKATETMKYRLNKDEILLGIIVYNKAEEPILGTKGWFISQIIDINKNIKINFIDDTEINVLCVESINSPNIISHFIDKKDKSKSPKEQLNSILSHL